MQTPEWPWHTKIKVKQVWRLKQINNIQIANGVSFSIR